MLRCLRDWSSKIGTTCISPSTEIEFYGMPNRLKLAGSWLQISTISSVASFHRNADCSMRRLSWRCSRISEFILYPVIYPSSSACFSGGRGYRRLSQPHYPTLVLRLLLRYRCPGQPTAQLPNNKFQAEQVSLFVLLLKFLLISQSYVSCYGPGSQPSNYPTISTFSVGGFCRNVRCSTGLSWCWRWNTGEHECYSTSTDY
uniref:uncharacterized protein LOC105351949 n=1 Tax=Fragaria vesca subsp. vesca TaxID=101020 RepID=UPI0005CA6E82|nr:PREDICTED: uncharacterized protein LOC105351949 [Fragaria vesca subsp. vesca]